MDGQALYIYISVTLYKEVQLQPALSCSKCLFFGIYVFNIRAQTRSYPCHVKIFLVKVSVYASGEV